MKDTMMDILDRLNRHVAALGFIADHVEDNQTSMALATIEDDMIKTVELLGNMKNL
jgi:hypothetical protein